MNCSNCDSKIGKAIIGKDNKGIGDESLKLLNNFLPESLRRNSFCEKCASYKPKVDFISHIYLKYKRYLGELKITLNKLNRELDELNSKILIEKGNVDFNFNSIKLFSNSPENYELLEFIESYIIVDSGMWSTSSDNLDALWSAVHDKAAREGKDSQNKLTKGFEDSKKILKKKAFIIGGNSVVDVSFNFSELAGNGKILIYCQGTAAINKSNPVPSFDEVNEKYRDQLKTLSDKIDGVENELNIKTLVELTSIIKDLKFYKFQ